MDPVIVLHITRKEIVGSGVQLSPHHEANLSKLLAAVNRFRSVYGKPMIVSSGFRSMEDHLRIYREIAARKGIPFDAGTVPMRSAHLSGEAVDFRDQDGSLDAFCEQNTSLLEQCGIWVEHSSATPGWCHMQTRACNNRYFHP